MKALIITSAEERKAIEDAALTAMDYPTAVHDAILYLAGKRDGLKDAARTCQNAQEECDSWEGQGMAKSLGEEFLARAK